MSDSKMTFHVQTMRLGPQGSLSRCKQAEIPWISTWPAIRRPSTRPSCCWPHCPPVSSRASSGLFPSSGSPARHQGAHRRLADSPH